MDFLFEYIPLLFGLLFWGLFSFWSWKREQKKLEGDSEKGAFSREIIWLGLIFLLFVGFLGRLDFSMGFGCLGGNGPVWYWDNILSFVASSSLITLAMFSRNRLVSAVFWGIQLALWLFKLFFLKGGYAVGFIGGADPFVESFDFIMLGLMLVLIGKQFNIPGRRVLMPFLTAFLIVLRVSVYGKGLFGFWESLHHSGLHSDQPLLFGVPLPEWAAGLF